MLKIDKSLLVVVDIQDKLFQVMSEKDALLKNADVLIKAMQRLNIPILWCQQYPKALGETVSPLKEQLVSSNQPIDKFSFSCYGHDEFKSAVKHYKKEDILLCGIEAHVCVYQTAMDLLDDDFRVHLVTDAITSRSPSNCQLAIDRMVQEGVSLTSVEMVLFELMRSSKHEAFKDISKLIKNL